MYLEYYKKKEEQNCFLKKNNQPKKRVEAKNEKHWRKLRRIYFHRFFEDCFHHRKTFNWVKTSVASRYNTAKPLIGRAHTHTHTHTRAQRSSQLFSRCRFDRLIALLHPPLTKEKEKERERPSCSSRERYLRTALSVSLAPTTLFNFVGFPDGDLDRKARLRPNRNFPWNSENTRVLRKTRGQTE